MCILILITVNRLWNILLIKKLNRLKIGLGWKIRDISLKINKQKARKNIVAPTDPLKISMSSGISDMRKKKILFFSQPLKNLVFPSHLIRRRCLESK